MTEVELEQVLSDSEDITENESDSEGGGVTASVLFDQSRCTAQGKQRYRHHY